MKAKMALLASLLCLALPEVISSCECSPKSFYPLVERIAGYDCVIIGTVLRLKAKDDFSYEATVSVQKVWVGNAQKEICVSGCYGRMGLCCSTLMKGKQYLIFARARNNEYYTEYCDRTTEVSQCQTDINALGTPAYDYEKEDTCK